MNKSTKLNSVPTSDSRHEASALELLRTYRQQSGYVPWPHPDNEQLREADRQRQRRAQDAWEFSTGLAAYRKLPSHKVYLKQK